MGITTSTPFATSTASATTSWLLVRLCVTSAVMGTINAAMTACDPMTMCRLSFGGELPPGICTGA